MTQTTTAGAVEQLARAAAELNVATDGMEQLRPQRQAVLDALTALTPSATISDATKRMEKTLGAKFQTTPSALSGDAGEGENCPRCDDSGYQEFSSGGLMGGPVKVTREFCDCACGQDARDQAAGVGMHGPAKAAIDDASPSAVALRLYDEWDAMPADRGGKNGPKGRAFAAFIAAKAAALPSQQGAGE